MADHRWSKFWWSDWQSDPCLRLCSFAAKGLWVDLLSIAFNGQPQGYVTINGRNPTHKEIAAIVGGTREKEVATLIAELEKNGVFSRSEDGTIYSRRMVKDKQAVEIARQHGQRGGNPILKAIVNPTHKPTLKGKLNGTHKPTLILEADAESEAEVVARSRAHARADPFAISGVTRHATDQRPVVNGFYLDGTWRDVIAAASLDANKRWDLAPLVGWLAAGIEPDVIVAAIARVAARPTYSPAGSLKFFDGAVREQRRVA